MTGPLTVHLSAASSARDTDFTAKLVDVYPDGRAYNIVEGIMRLSGRNLDGVRAVVPPDQVDEYVITMGGSSQVFGRGHRIRLNFQQQFPDVRPQLEYRESDWRRCPRRCGEANDLSRNRGGVVHRPAHHPWFDQVKVTERRRTRNNVDSIHRKKQLWGGSNRVFFRASRILPRPFWRDLKCGL